MASVAATRRVAGLLFVDGILTDTEITYESAITMIGLETVASCLGAPFNFKFPWMPFIGMGQGEKPVSTEDKYLETEIFRKQGVVTATETIYQVFAKFTDAELENPFILREVGIFDKIVGGRMAARFQLDYDIIVAQGDEVEITVYIYVEIGDD